MRIERRFCGPPDSGHGGYSCGLVAERIDAPAAWVSLRVPPPLDRDLEVREGDDGAVFLVDGDTLVAEGGPAELDITPPEPVAVDEATAAQMTGRWLHGHPFPSCFGCGPQRSTDEAIAIIPGPLDGRPELAAPWTPLADMAGDDGQVTTRLRWAALDCPTAFPMIHPGLPPHVLARLTARLGPEPVLPGRPHVVLSWLLGREGRKARAAAAIFTADGGLCGVSEGLWIALRDPSVVAAGEWN